MNKDQILNSVCLDWLLIMLAGMITHLRQLCVSGLCSPELTQPPDVSSIIFCYAVTSLIAEFKWWPCSLKKPHKLIVSLYQIGLTCFLVDLSMKTVYVSLIAMYTNLFTFAADQATKVGLKGVCHLSENIELYVSIVACTISIYVYFLVMYITERADDLLCFFNEIKSQVKRPKESLKKKVH